MARYIAFDFGTRRVGVAVTDSGAMIAAPEGTYPPEKLAPEIRRLLSEEPCAGFVVGMPGLVLGTATHSTEPIRAFADRLRKAHPDVPRVRGRGPHQPGSLPGHGPIGHAQIQAVIRDSSTRLPPP